MPGSPPLAVDVPWQSVRMLHVLAMTFFVGGQLVLAAAVVPVERRNPDRTRLRGIARLFGWGSLVAVGVLLATGAALASHYGLWSSATLHLKLALVAVTAVLVLWHMRRPEMHAIEGAVFVTSLVIVWLGLTLAHAG